MQPMAARFRLLYWLTENKISQRELARRANVSPTTVNQMAKNRTAQVSLGTLDVLSRELGCEPGDLIERAPDEPKPAPRVKAKAKVKRRK